VQDGIDKLIGKIEPTLVIITSIIVGVILFSVMLPLMGIMTSIG
jgi:type IV pilus assembly protein PilC